MQANALALQSDGKIMVAGQETNSSFTSSAFGVARFKSNGTVDQSFGSGGTVATQILPPGQSCSDEFASAVLLGGNGRILVAGSALLAGYRGDQTTGAVVRYNPDGSLDQSFGSGGIAASGRLAGLFTPSMLPGISALGLDSAGDIFVIPAASELSPSGQLDASVSPATIVSSSHDGPEAFLANGQSAPTAASTTSATTSGGVCGGPGGMPLTLARHSPSRSSAAHRDPTAPAKLEQPLIAKGTSWEANRWSGYARKDHNEHSTVPSHTHHGATDREVARGSGRRRARLPRARHVRSGPGERKLRGL